MEKPWKPKIARLTVKNLKYLDKPLNLDISGQTVKSLNILTNSKTFKILKNRRKNLDFYTP